MTDPVSIALIAFLSSVMGSAATAALLYVVARRLQRSRLDALLDEYIEIMKKRLKEGVEEAGRDLLPEFREEVRRGFKEGMNDVVHGELLDQTARTLARSGADIVETGLNLLTGRRARGDSESHPKS